MSETSLLDLEKKELDPARYSVQSRADDAPFAPTTDVAGGGGVFWINLGAQMDTVPKWNAIYPNFRDRYLNEFARDEGMLASAVYSMKTRVGTLNYKVDGPPRAKKFAQDLLNNPGMGDNLSTLVQKVSGDLDTTDNGAFVELWRAGNPNSDAKDRPVLGFAHLDSRQCWRSFDPEFPVWYTNPITAQVRKIHHSRVVMVADNPQSVELARGIGFCATSRVMRMTRVFRDMQIYLEEKVGGRFSRAIGAINGVTAHQVKNALMEADKEADNKGYLVYKDIPFLISPSGEKDHEIKFMIQDLASIPDGFVFRDDADLYAYILAFCFGVDAREFWPATQSGATKADATVQNMKARGRGIGNRIQTVEYMIRKGLPETVTFEYDYTDDEQDQLQADISDTRVRYFDMLVKNGTISAQENRAIMVAQGIIDGRLLETLQAPGTADTNAEDPQPTTTTPNTEDSADPNDTDVVEEKVLKSTSAYRRALRENVRALWTGAWSLIDFYTATNATIRRGFDQAWDEGAAKFGITSGERSDEEQQRLTLEINTETTYVIGFGKAIIENSKANGGLLTPLLDRVDMWVNSYNRIVSLAGTMAAADAKGEWMYGDTIDHCPSCSGYAGRVYRNSTWRKYLEPYDLMPKGKGLACKGFECQCGIYPTTRPITKGRPPIIQKAHHNHVHDAVVYGVA